MSEIIMLFYFYILCKLLEAKAYLYPLHAIKACQPGVNHNNSQCHMHHSQLCWHATLINNATLQVEMNRFCNSPKIGAEIWHNSQCQKVMYFPNFPIKISDCIHIFISRDFSKEILKIQKPQRERKLNL